MTALAVTVRHNFETGHRLPQLGGKCQNLHGHSWWVEVTLTGPYDPATGTVVEFGAAKAALRAWIDANLDHGLMLGDTDPLADVLAGHGKVFRFGAGEHTRDLAWPSVENVAVLLGRVATAELAGLGARVATVRVTETHVNAATWTAA